MRILVVEDNREMAAVLARNFAAAGINCDHAESVADAELLIGQIDYRLAVLDLGLPDEDGMALLKRLRTRRNPLPVIVLTARGDAVARVEGLRAGADDFVVKPFLFDELHARLEAVLRRNPALTGPEISFGPVTLDLNAREASVGGAPLKLSRREAELFEPLVRRGGHVVTKRTLESQLFGSGGDLGSNAIEVYVHRLRRKLQLAQSGLDIETVRGIGYVLIAP